MRGSTIGLLVFGLSFLAHGAERVGDFTLLDHKGVSHSMSWYDDQNAVVLLAQANQCSSVQESVMAFSNVQDRYDDANLQLLMLNAEGSRDRGLVAAEAERYGVDIPILLDDSQMISRALDIKQAGKRCSLLYDLEGCSSEQVGNPGLILS